MMVDVHEVNADDDIDKWMKNELEQIRNEFANRLNIIIEQYSKKKFGKLGEQIARDIVVNIGIEVK